VLRIRTEAFYRKNKTLGSTHVNEQITAQFLWLDWEHNLQNVSAQLRINWEQSDVFALQPLTNAPVNQEGAKSNEGCVQTTLAAVRLPNIRNCVS